MADDDYVPPPKLTQRAGRGSGGVQHTPEPTRTNPPRGTAPPPGSLAESPATGGPPPSTTTTPTAPPTGPPDVTAMLQKLLDQQAQQAQQAQQQAAINAQLQASLAKLEQQFLNPPDPPPGATAADQVARIIASKKTPQGSPNGTDHISVNEEVLAHIKTLADLHEQDLLERREERRQEREERRQDREERRRREEQRQQSPPPARERENTQAPRLKGKPLNLPKLGRPHELTIGEFFTWEENFSFFVKAQALETDCDRDTRLGFVRQALHQDWHFHWTKDSGLKIDSEADDWKDAVKKIQDYIRAHRCIFVDRDVYFNRKQHQNESSEDYLAKLRELLRACSYREQYSTPEELSQERLLDRFLTGLHDEHIRQECFQLGNTLTLEQALKRATEIEAGRKGSNLTKPKSSSHQVNAAQRQSSYKTNYKNSPRTPYKPANKSPPQDPNKTLLESPKEPPMPTHPLQAAETVSLRMPKANVRQPTLSALTAKDRATSLQNVARNQATNRVPPQSTTPGTSRCTLSLMKVPPSP